MIPITLSAVEVYDNNERTGRELHSRRQWFIVPRIGETLPLHGNEYTVSNVYHEFDLEEIVVEFRTEGFDFEVLVRAGWKQIRFETVTA